MNSTMTKIAAAVLAMASTGAMAAPVAWTGTFEMYNPVGGQLDANDGAPGVHAAVTGVIDTAAGTFTLASTDTFFGVPWSTTGGTLFGAGTHTVNVNGDGSNVGSGDGNVTFTVGAGQLGANVNFNWGASTGIDVFMVWNTATVGGMTIYTSTDVDGNGILGLGMVDGPFVGFSANFSMGCCLGPQCCGIPPDPEITPSIPEASTYAMMLAGLGLVGFMARRRRQAEV